MKQASKRQREAKDISSANLGSNEDHLLYRSVYVFALSIIAVCVYATFSPSSDNWGIHHLAFAPPFVKFGFLLSMIALLFPSVQIFLLNILEKITVLLRSLTRTQKAIIAVFGTFLLILFFWMERESILLLGDGSIMTRKIMAMQGLENIPEYYPNEPLVGVMLYYTRNLLEILGFTVEGEMPFQALSIASGVGFIICSALIVKRIENDGQHSALLLLFFISIGALEIFFGYVEMYAPSAFALSLFLFFSLKYFQENISIVYPITAFALLAGTHIAMLCLFPAVGVMILYSRYNLTRTILLAGSSFVVVLVLSLLGGGYSWKGIAGLFLESHDHFLPLFHADRVRHPYTLFSLRHISEMAQLHLLYSPFVLVMFVAALILFRKKLPWKNIELYFWLFVAVCSFGFAALICPDLEMGRDWDLFAPLFIAPLAALGVIVWRFLPLSIYIRRTMFITSGITLLLSVSWIGLTANEDAAIARFRILPDEQIWTKKALLDAYEALAITYRGRMDGPGSVEYYKKYLSIDSTNPRIWGCLGYVYQLMGDDANQLLAYEGAMRHGTNDYAILSDLGILELKHLHPEKAIPALQQSLTVAPALVDAQFYLGVAFLNTGRARDAASQFQKTIAMAPGKLNAYIGAIKAYISIQDTANARNIFSQYLQYAPANAPITDSLRKQLKFVK